MNRKKPIMGGVESLISASKDLFNNRRLGVPTGPILSAARFRGKLGASIAVITSLTVGFLTIPNNILYFINNKHGTRTTGRLTSDSEQSSHSEVRPDYEYAYIHAGIALVTLGCLAMVVSIVLSYFASKSKRKMDDSDGFYKRPESVRSTRTVMACLIMMNIELFMAVIAGCMELLYQPMIGDAQRLHNMECAIAVFNIVLYIMYVVTMVLTSTVLKGKHEVITVDGPRDIAEAVAIPSSARDYISRSINSYNSQSSFI